ncbi:bifunctional tRNA (5-methylaminomethyl-2-thiouridine)(34)-methyltransferase MnmD/FAD-dependent 5-carboxymethylaminomethyl-2-thiouridine(34) oxidoreductase MnmC [Nitrogeniibacter aestuarii]|uniref:bifunctional tRNA (5-methylaminomethyl-2-thiouridine)(34)-methyltransferase MnmD/FAD-dependent 5-carboxymethylaminomethyl-2-thiouridine(34) oxidoreductase MnmC n=1 Tax=Nitrogeniibacter aestuarii TaxID=2815343 RepID=UPI001E450539|nr:bifunctional tRNA (5-methylaminomethyl-2-thiouridine)(34)-methyltransferase MnmD/FAD-dependent 5-carboxymethylaminomethyl-2-thiouridine(34) oxidoreductase MnmC [Nitrogeniibacter aestuarii]
MFERIEPAVLEFAEDGTPWSSRFGDVYHTDQGALGQAAHVFLAGNGLPGRWQGRDRFVIVETGFGLGLNFLATWQTWRHDPARPHRLHFVSFEKHPFSAADLARAHQAFPALKPLSDQLCSQWPLATPGLHRLSLDADRVILSLYLGDAVDGLGRVHARADAFYLDGFSPAKNPDLWSERVCHQLAALAAPDATLATWSVSGQVRRHLAYAHFDLEKAPGYAGKREMLVGRFVGQATPAPAPAERSAIVVGAGIAGTSIANRLARLDWKVTVVDQAEGPGHGASGNHAGVLRPLPSLDDNRISRLTRAGSLAGRRHLEWLDAQAVSAHWGATGVLHLAVDAAHAERQKAVVEAHQAPVAYQQFISASRASDIAGWPLPAGGWWFPSGAWVNPPSVCRANLHQANIQCRFDMHIHDIVREHDQWVLMAEDGVRIAHAPVLILANGVGIRSFPDSASLPVRAARGQVSHLPAAASSPPHVVVCRQGYVTPAFNGMRCAGATFIVDDDGTELRADEHAENMEKLEYMLPGFGDTLPPTDGAGRVGFRPVSPDRLPIAGGVPVPGDYASDATLDVIERMPGLYALSGFGARGIVWSAIVADQLASELNGDPWALETDLRDSIDPGRFVLRKARKAATDRS